MKCKTCYPVRMEQKQKVYCTGRRSCALLNTPPPSLLSRVKHQLHHLRLFHSTHLRHFHSTHHVARHLPPSGLGQVDTSGLKALNVPTNTLHVTRRADPWLQNARLLSYPHFPGRIVHDEKHYAEPSFLMLFCPCHSCSVYLVVTQLGRGDCLPLLAIPFLSTRSSTHLYTLIYTLIDTLVDTIVYTLIYTSPRRRCTLPIPTPRNSTGSRFPGHLTKNRRLCLDLALYRLRWREDEAAQPHPSLGPPARGQESCISQDAVDGLVVCLAPHRKHFLDRAPKL
eukprot:1183122-Rhodomonas_salina.1